MTTGNDRRRFLGQLGVASAAMLGTRALPLEAETADVSTRTMATTGGSR